MKECGSLHPKKSYSRRSLGLIILVLVNSLRMSIFVHNISSQHHRIAKMHFVLMTWYSGEKAFLLIDLRNRKEGLLPLNIIFPRLLSP